MDILRRTRRLLKTLGEDNRLRILNLLRKRDMNVAELCEILGSTQSNISRHLARLRLVGIVLDRRDGQFIYYRLSTPSNKFHRHLIDSVITGLSELGAFEADMAALERRDTAAPRYGSPARTK